LEQDVVTLSADAILDDKLVETILLSGYSRFPVHEPNDPDAFIGLLLIKKVCVSTPSQHSASFPCPGLSNSGTIMAICRLTRVHLQY
jgi:metal transporter CNNM